MPLVSATSIALGYNLIVELMSIVKKLRRKFFFVYILAPHHADLGAKAIFLPLMVISTYVVYVHNASYSKKN